MLNLITRTILTITYSILTFITLCIFFPLATNAQSAQKPTLTNSTLTTSYFDTPDVLIKAGIKQTRSLFKDSRGFIWIGTSNGLYRFDGTHVAYLRHIINDTTTIPDNVINNIAEDTSGLVWIGTNGGIGCVNPYNLSCKVFSEFRRNLNDDFDNRMVVDKQGNIWAGNIGGLSRFDKNTGRFIPVWSNHEPTFSASTHIITISNLSKDSLAFSTYSNLVFFDKHHNQYRSIPLKSIRHTGTVFITRLFLDNHQRLWMTTWTDGLIRYNKGQFISYQLPDKGKMPVIFSIASTYEENRQYIWLGLGAGLYKVALDEQLRIDPKSSVLFSRQNTHETLENRPVEDILADKTTGLWAADNGIQQLNNASGVFKTVFNVDGAIQDIQQLKLHGKWYYFVSTWYRKKGLYVLDENFKFWKTITFPTHHQDDNQDISGIAQDKWGRIWVSTFSGVFMMDQDLHLLSNLPTSGKDSLTRQQTNSIAIIHDTVWIGCYKKGIDLYNLQLHKICHFNRGDHGLDDDLFWKFYCDSYGNTWVCGDNMLYRFHRDKNCFEKFLLTTEGRGCAPREIAERPDHSLLIASSNGLIHFDPLTHRYTYMSTPLLLDEEAAFSMTLDKRGDPWYLTTDHLVNYNFQEQQYHVYGKEDGLDVNRDFFVLRRFQSPELIIGQQGQIVTVDTSRLHQFVERPGIFLTQLRINDSTFNFPFPVHQLKLAYTQNKIYLEFTGINFQKSYQNIYAYRLEGVDKNWMYSAQNIASYANLSPGAYTFQVKVKNYEGIWSPVYSLAIRINAPFWKQWWFIILAVAFIVTVIYLVHRYQLKQALKLEQLRNKISADLHDDIGSTLSSISILSDIAIKEKDWDHSRQMINEVKETSISLMEKMDDIVWSINPDNDSLENIFLRIKRFASKVLEAKNIRFEMPIHPEFKEIAVPMDYRQHIYMILKEGINNCVKYSNCSQVKLDIQLRRPYLQVILTDNGQGFNKNEVQLGNGLLNMQQRASLMHGSLEIVSAKGLGTVIHLHVKIL